MHVPVVGHASIGARMVRIVERIINEASASLLGHLADSESRVDDSLIVRSVMGPSRRSAHLPIECE